MEWFDEVTIEKYNNGAIYDPECIRLAKQCVASIIATDNYIDSVAAPGTYYFDIADSAASRVCNTYRQTTKVLQDSLIERIRQVKPKHIGWKVHLSYGYEDLDSVLNADNIYLFLKKKIASKCSLLALMIRMVG